MISYCLAERTLTALGQGDIAAARGFAAESGLIASRSQQVHLGQERIYAAIGRFSEAIGDRNAALSARQSALSALDTQARQIGPGAVVDWSTVLPRLEVVEWAGWSLEEQE